MLPLQAYSAMEPAILVLDEPTAGLDPLGRKELMNLFKTHQSGMTIVLVTHLMDDVAEYANQVYVMEKGRLVKGVNRGCLSRCCLYGRSAVGST